MPYWAYLYAILMMHFAVWSCATVPLGLTKLRDDSIDLGSVLATSDSAYVQFADGVWIIDESGVGEPIVPSHPMAASSISAPIRMPRVVQTDEGGVFFLGGFDKEDGGGFWALYDLQDPATPLRDYGPLIIGMDKELVVYGFNGFTPIDGNHETLSSPWTLSTDVTPNGIIGGYTLYESMGIAGPSITTIEGQPFLIAGFGSGTLVADREDGQGFNVGVELGHAGVIYFDGSGRAFTLFGPSGGFLSLFGELPVVTESDFVLVDSDIFSTVDDYLVFYPGINPSGIGWTRKLIDVFPSLQTIDFDSVEDVTSHKGRLHFLLSGDDGSWLFVAPDPSVVPEPLSAMLITACSLVVIQLRTSRANAAETVTGSTLTL